VIRIGSANVSAGGRSLALVRTPLRKPQSCSGVHTTVEGRTVLSTGGRPDRGAATHPRRIPKGWVSFLRFAIIELAIWARRYGAYLAIRGLTIGSRTGAHADATAQSRIGPFRTRRALVLTGQEA
jgi:hypothetical protein